MVHYYLKRNPTKRALDAGDYSASFEICPCCGIQYGYDDAAGGKAETRPDIYAHFRESWKHAGLKWNSRAEPPPPNWGPNEQLNRLTN